MLLYSEILKSNKKVEFNTISQEVAKTTNSLCERFVERYQNSPGLKITKDTRGYKYTLGRSRMNTDPFVRKAMKLSDKSMYDSIAGYSKQPDLELTLDTLAKYSHTQARKIVNKNDLARDAWDMAIREARYKFKFSGLIPYSNKQVLAEMEQNSAAGFSFPGKKKKDVMDEIGSVARKMTHDIQDGRITYVPPCKIAQRGHLHDAENPKSRPVYVMPAEIIVLEGRFAIPYIEKLKETKTVLIGENSLKNLIHMLNPVSQKEGEYSVAIDWSSFDSSVPNWLIDEAFKIIKESFSMQYKYNEIDGVHSAKRGKTEEIRERKSVEGNLAIFNWIQTNFKKTKIMLPNGVIMKKMHGIPSGSYFTQVVGSICNYIVISFIMHMMGFSQYTTSVLGDDSYTRLVKDGFSLDKASAIAKKYFKMFLNVKKSSIKNFHESQKFLGYEVQGYRLVRKDEEFAKMALYPERDVNTLEQSISRVFAYYLLGGVNSPWYCKFYHDYFGMYDKYNVQSFSLHAGIYRTLRYVVGLDVRPMESFQFDPGTICSLLVAYHFAFDYGIYKSDLFDYG